MSITCVMRMFFAADYESGYGATKTNHTIRGAGVRYVVTLYRLKDGEVLAIIDGRLITETARIGKVGQVFIRRLLADPRFERFTVRALCHNRKLPAAIS